MKNKEVFWSSIIALICIICAFLIHWILFLPAIIIMIRNKKILGITKENSNKKTEIELKNLINNEETKEEKIDKEK